MAYVAEDGTGLANANALCDLAFADTYFADRGVTTWAGADALKQSALIRATDYVEGRWQGKWKGSEQFPDVQGLSFPRLYIGHDGAVPPDIKKAVAEYALRTLGGTPLAPDPVYDASGFMLTKAKEKVGPIETEYSYTEGGAAALIRAYPAADMLIRPFVRGNGGLVRA